MEIEAATLIRAFTVYSSQENPWFLLKSFLWISWFFDNKKKSMKITLNSHCGIGPSSTVNSAWWSDQLVAWGILRWTCEAAKQDWNWFYLSNTMASENYQDVRHSILAKRFILFNLRNIGKNHYLEWLEFRDRLNSRDNIVVILE